MGHLCSGHSVEAEHGNYTRLMRSMPAFWRPRVWELILHEAACTTDTRQPVRRYRHFPLQQAFSWRISGRVNGWF